MAAEILYISNARLSFPHLIEPQTQINAKGDKRVTWSADLIVPPDHQSLQQFMLAVQKVATDKWKEHANAVLQMVQGDRKNRCFGSGNEKVDKKTFQPYAGYNGHMYITAISTRMPQIIGADGKVIDPANSMAVQAAARRLYGGCRVNAAVQPWAQDNTHGRAIRCELIAVQFAGDDEPFGESVPDASGMFGAVQGPATHTPQAPGIPGLPSFFGANQ